MRAVDFRRKAYRRFRSIFSSFFSNKPSLVVLCGFSRSGTSLLYNILSQTAPKYIETFDREISALNFYPPLLKSAIIKRPLDIFNLEEIVRVHKHTHNIFFILQKRDLRELLCSKHSSIGGQYFQGADYQFSISEDGETSYTSPGLISVAEEFLKAREGQYNFMEIDYSDLTKNPADCLESVREFTGINFLPFSVYDCSSALPGIEVALNGARPIKPPCPKDWLTAENIRWIRYQIELFPLLDEYAVHLGYPFVGRFLDNINFNSEVAFCRRGLIIGFYTSDELYSSEASRLIKSLEGVGLEYRVESYDAGANWEDSCSQKPFLMREARERFSGALLYVDVDAVVYADPWPYLSMFSCDVAVCVLEDGEMLSGTVLLNDTDGCRSLLDEWCRQQSQNRNIWDQRVLQSVVEKLERSGSCSVVIWRLPPNFAYIFDRNYPFIYGDKYIEHFQASREQENGASPSSPLLASRREALKNHGG